MLFSPFEILDAILMTLIVGYLFKDLFAPPRRAHAHDDDVLDYYRNLSAGSISWSDFWYACALIAPSILIHELGHKFTALAFGLDATFHAACSTVDLAAGGSLLTFTCSIQLFAVIMKMLGMSFLIFIPAFVTISGGATHLQQVLISFAGPAVHLVFWLVTAYVFKYTKTFKGMPRHKVVFWYFFKQINMILFIFNMLPIPGFDGFWVVYNLFKFFVPG